MNQDIRWKQRFQNFQQALQCLELAVKQEKLDILQQAGMIQFFEMCFDLSWKLLKDYLEEEGYTELQSPRAAIKQAFASGLIQDGHLWIKLLVDRNLTTHIYDELTAKKIQEEIRNTYYPLFKELDEIFIKLDNE